MPYDCDEQRINAFIICNNKVYEGTEHYDCFLKALEEAIGEKEMRKNHLKYYEMNHSEIIKITGEVIIGEVTMINNEKSLICYDETTIGIMKKHYGQLPIYRFDDEEVFKIVA